MHKRALGLIVLSVAAITTTLLIVGATGQRRPRRRSRCSGRHDACP